MTQPIKEGRHVGKIRRKSLQSPWQLTDAQLAVVVAICQGHETQAGAARYLGISPRTLQSHKLQIHLKMGVQHSVGIVLKVLDDPQVRKLCFPHLRITDRKEPTP